MKPLGNRLLLRAVVAPAKVGALWVPPAAEGQFTVSQAEVVAVGPAVRDSRLQAGLRVVVRRFGRAPLDREGALWAVEEPAVLAIVAQ